MSRRNHEINAAAHIVMAGYDHPLGLNGFDEGIEKDVGHIFVKVAFVAKTPQKLLETFRFEAERSGRIFDSELREIGLPGQRAQGCKLLRLKANGVIVGGMRVGKSFQCFCWLQWHNKRSLHTLEMILRTKLKAQFQAKT